MDDVEHMGRAMELAATVRSTTTPNPWVGAVVVTADGATVSARAPRRHQVVPMPRSTALRQAGEAARGATLYSTLEPCSHHGRTPPCVEAIIDAGVARVVVGVEDPDPQVAGQGLAALADAGIEVVLGVAADEVSDQLAPYLKHRTTGQPWVVLKMAASLDARTAAPDGTSRWITGEEARRDVHRLRARSDAVLVGAGTVRADDPELTVRLGDGRGTSPAAARGPRPGPRGSPGPPGPRAVGRSGPGARRARPPRRAPGPGRRRPPGRPRFPSRRPGRPLRPLPGTDLLRRRRRPAALFRSRSWHNCRCVEGQIGVGRTPG